MRTIKLENIRKEIQEKKRLKGVLKNTLHNSLIDQAKYREYPHDFFVIKYSNVSNHLVVRIQTQH